MLEVSVFGLLGVVRISFGMFRVVVGCFVVGLVIVGNIVVMDLMCVLVKLVVVNMVVELLKLWFISLSLVGCMLIFLGLRWILVMMLRVMFRLKVRFRIDGVSLCLLLGVVVMMFYDVKCFNRFE